MKHILLAIVGSIASALFTVGLFRLVALAASMPWSSGLAELSMIFAMFAAAGSVALVAALAIESSHKGKR